MSRDGMLRVINDHDNDDAFYETTWTSKYVKN